jgi:hypothetical protein
MPFAAEQNRKIDEGLSMEEFLTTNFEDRALNDKIRAAEG